MKEWLLHIRTSGRFAFLLRLATLLPSSLLALWWTRLLLHAMGANNFGLFMAFQGILGLGFMGDLGMGGALSIRTTRFLASGETVELYRLHATARSFFLGLAGVGLILIVGLSPWLPALFRFVETPASGSMSALFAAGGLVFFFTLLSAYYLATLYAVGTVSWTVLPPLLVFHLGTAFQLLCAILGAPLWIQLVPSVVLAFGCLLLYHRMVRASHPELAGPLPLRFDSACGKSLLQSSFWAYLFSISFCIYTTTDRLIINAGFGASRLTPYLLNFRLCEAALSLAIGILYVALPKIVMKLLSPDAEKRKEGRLAAEKLRKTQIFIGCAATIVYLTVNGVFVHWWFGPQAMVPFGLQVAFAFTLLLTIASESDVQFWGRLSEEGLRRTAVAVFVSALINLGLSYAAMSVGWVAGVAWATAIARTVFALLAIRAVSSVFQVSFGGWLKDVVFAPAIALSASILSIRWIAPQTGPQWIVLGGINMGIVVGCFFLCGLRPRLFHEEWRALLDLAKALAKTDRRP